MRRRQNTRGFTLVELVVSITISLILMVSVTVFISTGMKNIALQKKVIEGNSEDSVFFESLTSIVSSIHSGSLINIFGSGALFKIESDIFEGGFGYLGEKKLSEVYCHTGSSLQTAHLVYFPFIPYEGQGGNMFNHISQNTANILTNSFSGTLTYNGTQMQGKFFTPTASVRGSGAWANYFYVTDTLGQQVLQFDTTNLANPGIKIIGKGSFGKDLLEGDQGTNVFLNSPTGITYGESRLFISDTLNNRVLVYELSTKKIYTLLGPEAGLLEPTGVYYSSAERALYIANSGKGEILKYQSIANPIVPNLVMDITPGVSIPGVDNFSLDFFETGGPVTGNFSFTNFAGSSGYMTGKIDRLDYYFTDFSILEDDTGIIPIASCSNYDDYFLEDFKLKKETRICLTGSTGSVIITHGTQDTNLVAGNTYQIALNNIVGNFTGAQTFYTKLSLFDADTKVYEKYYPFFTNGDNLVYTKQNNTLSVFVSGLKYPTGVYGVAGNIAVNDFLQRQIFTYSSVGTLMVTVPSSAFDFSKIDDFAITRLYSPIKEFSVNNSGNILTISGKYYKTYSCEGNNAENIEKDFFFLQNLD